MTSTNRRAERRRLFKNSSDKSVAVYRRCEAFIRRRHILRQAKKSFTIFSIIGQGARAGFFVMVTVT